MASSLAGTRLGKYEVQAEIGRGGMGTVYLGYDPLLERQVAIKVLAPHLVWEEGFVERFLREARAAARLKHPNIVTIHDIGQSGSRYYFVMEFVQGRELRKIIRQQGPLAPKETFALLRPLASALDYAHEQGLVHRDIKPGNILVGPAGQVTLTDFGIARAAEEAGLTTAGSIVGTPEYMAPEQARGEKADARTDIYSLAIVAYEMLSGQTPFGGTTPHAVLHRQIYEPPPPIRQVRPELPEAVEAVLGRAMAKEPAARYETATAFVERLGHAMLPKAATKAAPEPAAKPEREVAVRRPTTGPPSRKRAAATARPGARPTPVAPQAATRRHVPGLVWALGGVAVLVLVAVVAVALAGFWRDGNALQPRPTEAAGQPVRTLPTSPQMASQPTATPPALATESLRVGLVVDVDGAYDAGFNQEAWKGLRRAQEELGVQAKLIESQVEAHYGRDIAALAEHGYDLIITVGFSLGDATAEVARQYPDTRFATVDHVLEPPLPNVLGITFAVDQAAFPSGYLAAGWADLKDPEDPQVAWIGGMPIPPVEQFIVAYEAGVEYYNQQKGRDVQVKGVCVGDFSAPERGRSEGHALLDGGVDVIFGVAGKTGIGGLVAARERSKWGIGVDVDQYSTLPGEKGILITSCMKRVNDTVFGLVRDATEDRFHGGDVYVATLRNEGVGLAPYHDFEEQIPPDLRRELDAIQEGIIHDAIATGWPPQEQVECPDPLGCVVVGPEEPLHIGFMFALSGPNQSLGVDALRGVEIAVEERREILGHAIELIGQDSACSADGGSRAAGALVEEPKLLAVLGTTCSDAARAAIPIMCEAGIPLVSPSNTAPELTDPARPPEYGCYLRTAPNDSFQGAVMAEYAYQALERRRAATLHDGRPYAEQLQQVFADTFRELGGEITAQETFSQGDPDMRPALNRIAASAPQFLYYPLMIDEGGQVTAQAREIPGLEGVTLAGSDGLFSPEFLATAGDAAVGMVLSSPAPGSGPAYEEFLQKYRDRYGERPVSPFHAYAYDAAMILMNAIEQSAVEGPEGILRFGRQALQETLHAARAWEGITGTLKCSEFGDCADPRIAVYQIVSGDPGSWNPGEGAERNPRRVQ